LALIRTLDAGEAGTEEAIRARIQELDNLASRFAGEPAAKEARLDVARLRLTLAQRYKTAGRASEDWRSELKAARQGLELVAGERNLQAQVLDLNGQIDKLLADQPPIIPPALHTDIAPPQPTPSVSALVAQARQLRDDGNYQEAERLIERVLRISRRNKEAQALRDWIRRAYDAEKK
jgi:tetratricopeptide (TPR) repeat protein